MADIIPDRRLCAMHDIKDPHGLCTCTHPLEGPQAVTSNLVVDKSWQELAREAQLEREQLRCKTIEQTNEIERLTNERTQFAQRLADCEISLGTFDPGAASEYWLKYAPGAMHASGHETKPDALTAAKELCDAAISLAGDIGLNENAWLWDKIHAFEAACCPVQPESSLKASAQVYCPKCATTPCRHALEENGSPNAVV